MSILFDHQKKIVQMALPILRDTGIVYLACEMRVGKSLAALALAVLRKWGKTLIVTKKKAIKGWKESCEKAELFGENIYIINYESLHKIDPDIKFDGVICDESHRLGSFPKPCKAQIILRKMGISEVILLSGTPSVESCCQLYHQFQISPRSPWSEPTFYKWHRAGNGVSAKKKIASGLSVNDWSQCDYDTIMRVAGRYMVRMTKSVAGFKTVVKVLTFEIYDLKCRDYCEKMLKDGIIQIDGQTIVGENPAAKLQKAHMLAGGTCIDDIGDRVVFGSRKMDFIRDGADMSKKHIVFTQYIWERQYLLDNLPGATDNLNDFRDGRFTFFIGSIKSYCEGTDFSWISGEMWIYSLSWSGATYLQILDRMSNIKRKSDVNVNVLLLSGGVDRRVFDAVSTKRNFNNSFYKGY